MKKKPTNCTHSLPIKRCVFRVRDTAKEEGFENRAILAKPRVTAKFLVPALVLNDLDKPCTLSSRDNQLMTSSNEPAATLISFENHTVH
jgi:hypothetical protein